MCAVLLFGCADHDEDLIRQTEAALAQSVELEIGLREFSRDQGEALVFRLAFDRSNDLDLYVTDPLMETVYFANHQTATGGKIAQDVRCKSEAGLSGVEEIRFEAPYPGRYRVGVDFAEQCRGTSQVAGYAVSVDGAGEHHTARGAVELGQFEVVVLEFELEGKR
jgi:hypothetical protein